MAGEPLAERNFFEKRLLSKKSGKRFNPAIRFFKIILKNSTLSFNLTL